MVWKPGRRTIIIVRAELIDDGGGSVRDWENATETEVKFCNIQPFIMSEKLQVEDNRDREFSRTGFRIWAPVNTDVLHTDRIKFDDHVHESLGQAGVWTTLTGKYHHVDILCRRYIG